MLFGDLQSFDLLAALRLDSLTMFAHSSQDSGSVCTSSFSSQASKEHSAKGHFKFNSSEKKSQIALIN